MRNIKLKIQYDGTDYHGWQIQKNDITVQETVKKAVQKIVNEDVHLTGCGRTDTGVHAENYVCNFFTNSRIPSEKLPYALNTYRMTLFVLRRKILTKFFIQTAVR